MAQMTCGDQHFVHAVEVPPEADDGEFHRTSHSPRVKQEPDGSPRVRRGPRDPGARAGEEDAGPGRSSG